MKTLYTIGYSDFSIESFIATLKKNKINAVVDVRSQPYSKYKSEFNREILKDELNKQKIYYVFLGEYCGARTNDQKCYINAHVDYKLLAQTENFQNGIKRILKGLEMYTLTLMCAEKDPITCHRTILICRNLKQKKVTIKHIISENQIENHEDSEKRLLKLFKIDEKSLFFDYDQLLNEAYDLQGKKIAYEKEYEGVDIYEYH